ncbi:MAG TPA: hypothetical protein VFQ03_04710 [Candidatus Binatia bacterium]|nr:hypothetical protein [Candidatus Binatia bacterium]
MVSNTVHMDQQEVIAALKRLKEKYSDDLEYKGLRKDLPKEWPI